MQRTRKPKYPGKNILMDHAIEPLVEHLITKKWVRKRLNSAKLPGFDVVSPIVELLRKNPNDIYEVGELLADEDQHISSQMVSIFSTAAIHSECREQVLSFLLQKLKDDNPKFRINSLFVFGNIVLHGVNIAPAIPEITDRLKDPNYEIRRAAGETLLGALEKIDISIAVPNLTKSLEDVYDKVRDIAATTLYHAARKGVDISIAVSNLTKNLESHDQSVRIQSTLALGEVAKHGADISQAVPNLVKFLSDSEQAVRVSIFALIECIKTANINTLELITKEVTEFIGSDWYHSQGELNTESYVRAVDAVATIMDVVRSRMNKEEREAA
ncbi:MAG: HEAT repeat domain-containing protein [Candidatus Micrarchaeota archaeon]|nr:HEAT repeat domain-containing protein [Candidatus Micrarchaeota archaeon]